MILLACDIPRMYDDTLRRYPFFRSTAEERRRLFGPIGRSRVPVVRPTARLAQRPTELKREPVEA
jgi:hypothetical protein